jgi:hypothetical protein
MEPSIHDLRVIELRRDLVELSSRCLLTSKSVARSADAMVRYGRGNEVGKGGQVDA